MQDLIKIVAMGKTFCRHKIEVRSCYILVKLGNSAGCMVPSLVHVIVCYG